MPLVRTATAIVLVLLGSAEPGRARTPIPDAVGPPSSAAILAQLPDGEMKRRFILDCTGCHQQGMTTAYPNGAPRGEAGWAEAITRMLGYAGARTGFPVIADGRDASATAEWLARSLDAAALERARRVTAPVSSEIATVEEFPMPAESDLPHDIAIDSAGRVVITGMMSHAMWVLDPESGIMDSVGIPVPRANPRAVEIAADGAWWVLLGAPRQVARYDPRSGRWRSMAIGMYPHSVAVDDARGRVWFNGHFTRDPELIGWVAMDGGGVVTDTAPPHPALAGRPGGPIPYELRTAPDGRVWFSELQGNRIVGYDPASGRFESHTLPTPWSGPRRFDIDAHGVLWIPAYAANALVRFDPSSGEFTELPLPIPNAIPYVARVDGRRGVIWIGTSAADAVLRFDPRSGEFAVVPLPSQGALVRHLAIDPRSGDVWAAYGASPGIPARIARIHPTGEGPADEGMR